MTMDKSSVISLVKIEYTQDDIGQQIPKETLREVFCEVTSITRAEWYEAGRSGMKPDYRFIVNQFDYEDEPEVEYLGKRYSVYRTYIGKNDDIDLYVERKAGTQ